MKKTSFLFLLLLPVWGLGNDWQTPFEKSGGTQSATYEEAIAWYQRLDQEYEGVQILEYGKTDIGKPLHLVVVSQEGLTDPAEARRQGKRVLLINNAIHAGEPCGVDACMMLVRDLMQKEVMQHLLDRIVIGIVPVYNIGGYLNRGRFSRANQEGPEAHGFRGNARNYDLNRDFIKADTRNARSFYQLFQEWMPDVFVDTHTTNGADYQAVLTYIATQQDKIAPVIADYMQEVMLPALQTHMDDAGQEMCPYVYSRGTPDDGIAAFIDLPRYSSGYAALFQTMSFITEAHMLKPYSQRVEATYTFLEGMLAHIDQHAVTIGDLINEARQNTRQQAEFDLAWELDRERVDKLSFKGYEAQYKQSEVTGQDRLYYDQEAPFTKEIDWLKHYKATATVTKPIAYIVPQGEEKTLERLRLNQIRMHTLAEDLRLDVEAYYIENLQTGRNSYEGHYYHRTLEVRKDTQEIQLYAGDVVVFTDQWRNPYLVHVLEPQAQDAFFRWNFYDGILMQKEYFSAYVFEETAAALLAADPVLKAAFEARKAEDKAFAENARAQLNFVYQRSPYYERTTLRRYPIFRWHGGQNLPLE
jgi:hypothetical protein